MNRRWHIAAAALAWTGAAIALHALGHDGPLALPTAWATGISWYERVGPVTATMALIRVVAMGLSAWLAAATALQLVASCRAGRRLRRAADGISPRWLTDLARDVANISLSAGLAIPVMAPALAVPQARPIAIQQDDGQADDGAAMQSAMDQPGIAVMQPLPDGEAEVSAQPTSSPPTPTTTAVPPAAPPARPESLDPPPASPGRAQTYVVQPGDSCWSIAEQALTDEHGTPPEDRQTAELWRKLIELNSERFATGDPDLLFAGQTLLLPATG